MPPGCTLRPPDPRMTVPRTGSNALTGSVTKGSTMTWPQGPGDPYGQQPGYDPYGQQPYSSQPYSAQPAYPPVAYPQPMYAGYPARSTNGLAIAALICGIAGLFFVPIVASVLGVIFGHIARKQCRENNENGDGMALGGLVTGYIGLGFYLAGCGLYLVFVLAIFGSAATTSGSSYSDVFTVAAQLVG